jgi:hypothetical protein
MRICGERFSAQKLLPPGAPQAAFCHESSHGCPEGSAALINILRDILHLLESAAPAGPGTAIERV